MYVMELNWGWEGVGSLEGVGVGESGMVRGGGGWGGGGWMAGWVGRGEGEEGGGV